MDVDGAAQDESVSVGPGQSSVTSGRAQSPSASASGSTASPSDIHMPVAENWCHTQVFSFSDIYLLKYEIGLLFYFSKFPVHLPYYFPVFFFKHSASFYSANGG